MLDYSVIIRTTGKAGEKYQCLLQSIKHLKPQPSEIIVVLPEGYELPDERLGTEKFCFSKKGMVTQRLYGIEQCKSPYALICDDDVCFDSDFVRKLHKPISMGIARLSAAPLVDFLPAKGIQSIMHAITGSAIPAFVFPKKYIKVLPTTGYLYVRNIHDKKYKKKYLEAESLPWTCFYGEVSAMKEINLQEEIWLEKNGYASLDDQTMFYKAYLQGIKTRVVSDAFYEHLDARTSRKVISEEIAYAMEFNRYVFWHRFFYSRHFGIRKAVDVLCIQYYYFAKTFYILYRYLKKDLNGIAIMAKRNAIKDACAYTRSNEYKNLENIRK